MASRAAFFRCRACGEPVVAHAYRCPVCGIDFPTGAPGAPKAPRSSAEVHFGASAPEPQPPPKTANRELMPVPKKDEARAVEPVQPHGGAQAQEPLARGGGSSGGSSEPRRTATATVASRKGRATPGARSAGGARAAPPTEAAASRAPGPLAARPAGHPPSRSGAGRKSGMIGTPIKGLRGAAVDVEVNARTGLGRRKVGTATIAGVVVLCAVLAFFLGGERPERSEVAVIPSDDRPDLIAPDPERGVRPRSAAPFDEVVEAETGGGPDDRVDQLARAQVPTAEVPGAQVPTAEVPGAQVPGAQVPGEQVPTAEVPTAEVPLRPEETGDAEPLGQTYREITAADGWVDLPAADAPFRVAADGAFRLRMGEEVFSITDGRSVRVPGPSDGPLAVKAVREPTTVTVRRP